MFNQVLEKAEEPEIKLPTSAGSSKKQESSRKTSISALLTMPKPLTVWITKKKKRGKILKEELPRSVGAKYATGDQWRNNSRRSQDGGGIGRGDHFLFY